MSSLQLKLRVVHGTFTHTSKYRVEVSHNSKLVTTIKQADAVATTVPRFEATTVALLPHDAVYDVLALRVIRKAGTMSPAHAVGDVLVPVVAASVRRGQVIAQRLSVRHCGAVRGELAVLFVFSGGDVDTPLPSELRLARRLRPGSLSFTVVEGFVDWRHPSLNIAGPANYKVVVALANKTGDVSTPAHRKVLNQPVWNTQFRVQIYDAERDAVLFTVKAHRDKMLMAKVDFQTDSYHTPTKFVAAARFPVFAVATYAALHGGSSEIDAWLPLLERGAETRRDCKDTSAGRLHVVMRYEPMAVAAAADDDNDDDNEAAAALVVGANVKVERRPFVGGRVLMSNTASTISFQGKRKERRAVLVDGTGHLPPHVLLEEMKRPLRAFLSQVPAFAIMPLCDADAHSSNSSFEAATLTRQPSEASTASTASASASASNSATATASDDEEDEEAGDEPSSAYHQLVAHGDGDAGTLREKGTFGRVLILPNSKVAKLDTMTLQLDVFGSPSQLIKFDSPAVADRWLTALTALQPTRGRWYADARDATWSNVADLKNVPSTIGVDHPRLDVPQIVVTPAAMSRALKAGSTVVDDALQAPPWLVESLLAAGAAGAAAAAAAAAAELASQNGTASPRAASGGATAPLQRLFGGLNRVASKHTEALSAFSKKAQAFCSADNARTSRGEESQEMKSADASSTDHASSADPDEDVSTAPPALPLKSRTKPVPPPKGSQSEYGVAPPAKPGQGSGETYSKAPAPDDDDTPYVVTPSGTDSTVEELMRVARETPAYEFVPPVLSPVSSASSIPTPASASASSLVGMMIKTPSRDERRNERRDTSFIASPAAVTPAPLQGVYADPDASMSETVDSDDDVVEDDNVAVATMFERLPRKYRVAFDELGVLSEELGRGIGGVVYKARLREADVAVKVIDTKDAEVVRDFLEEAMLLLELPPHPNVVIPVGLSQRPLSIVMMYCERGSLWGVLSSGSPPSVAHRVAILRDVAAGMYHVGREGIVHKDLAARNVLLTAGGTALVSDFGLSRIANERGAVYDTGICSIKWSSPESVVQKRFTTASDVWSFGVLTVETMTCKPPLPGVATSDFLLNYAEKRDEYARSLVASLPGSTPAAVRALTQRCLTVDPTQRPLFNDVCGQLRALLRTSPSGTVELVGNHEEPSTPTYV